MRHRSVLEGSGRGCLSALSIYAPGHHHLDVCAAVRLHIQRGIRNLVLTTGRGNGAVRCSVCGACRATCC